jgi:hypothetical protein
MNKSASLLTASSHKLNPALGWGFIILALIAYLLPWVVNPGVSLTLGAYDLAEWTSLARDVDMMPTVLLLRLPPVFLVLITALTFGYPRFTGTWWLATLFVLLMTAALLPPIEFLQDTANANYRQQLIVAVLAFIAGLIGLSGFLRRLRPVLILITAALASVIAVMGFSQAQQFMWALRLPATTGVGIVLFVVVMVIINLPPVLGGRSKGYSIFAWM